MLILVSWIPLWSLSAARPDHKPLKVEWSCQTPQSRHLHLPRPDHLHTTPDPLSSAIQSQVLRGGKRRIPGPCLWLTLSLERTEINPIDMFDCLLLLLLEWFSPFNTISSDVLSAPMTANMFVFRSKTFSLGRIKFWMFNFRLQIFFAILIVAVQVPRGWRYKNIFK